MKSLISSVIAVAGLAAASQGTIYFTFDDPTTALEVTYTEGVGLNPGNLSYNTTPIVDLVVDGSEHGLGIVTYTTNLAMDIDVGAGTGFGGFFSAPVSGVFTFSVGGLELLRGDIAEGAVLTFGTTGSLVATSSTFSLTLTASNALLAQLALGGFTGLAAQFDSSFSLSNLTPRPLGLNTDGFITSFNANAAFVGNADVIPSPGSAVLAGAAALCLLPGRRRPNRSGSLFHTVTAHV